MKELDTIGQAIKPVFLSHASEDKKDLVEPLIDCLKENGITGIWYDNDEIETGQCIIEKINEGLRNCKIGLVLFTPRFLQKRFANWELNSILYMHIYEKIRMLPMLYDITRDEVVARYPLLHPVKFETLSINCDKPFIAYIKKYLADACSIIDKPQANYGLLEIEINTKTLKIDNHKPQKINREITKISQNAIKEIVENIKSSEIPSMREANIEKIIAFASKRMIWEHAETWELVRYLLYSSNVSVNTEGLYILTEMLNLSKMTKDFFVVVNAAQLYLHRLLEFFHPKYEKRISYNSLLALESIMKTDDIFDLCITGIIESTNVIPNENDYSSYIQPILRRIIVNHNKDRLERGLKKLESSLKTAKAQSSERLKNMITELVKDYSDILY